MSKLLKLVCLLCTCVCTTSSQNDIHPCDRECHENIPPRICHYHFTMEVYQTLSRACYDCPYNKGDCYRPHCIHGGGIERAVTVINRQLPSPPIRVCEGDMVVVDITNNMVNGEGISLHWHGQHMYGNPFMDGAPMITQCPIPRHTTFRYKFVASVPGTHFYHGHDGFHRSDGAAGMLTVRLPRSVDAQSDLYDHDLSEHQMIVQDWILETSAESFVRHHHSDGDNKPRTVLVNGHGRYRTFRRSNRTVHSPLAVFRVETGLRYRFRVVNNGFLNSPLLFSIDNHTLLMISSDGNPFEPLRVDSFVIYAGERFDFVLTANASVSGNFWIRLAGLLDGRVFNVSQVAILRYDGAPEAEPVEPTDYGSMFRQGTQLNPLNSVTGGSKISIVDVKSKIEADTWIRHDPDYKFYLAYDFYEKNNNPFHHLVHYPIQTTNTKLFYPLINNISMAMPSSPLLSQIYDVDPLLFCHDPDPIQACIGRDSFCRCLNILKVGLESVVEIFIIDEGFKFNANHPFHLHGHSFHVIGMDRFGDNVTRQQIINLDRSGKIQRNFENPIVKDTVTVPDGGYTLIKFKATNPGFWMFHCHLAFHTEIGMFVIIQVGDVAEHPEPPDGFPKCGNYIPPISLYEKPRRVQHCALRSSSAYRGTHQPSLMNLALIAFVVISCGQVVSKRWTPCH